MPDGSCPAEFRVAGKSGLRYKYTVTQHSATAELYIDRGKESDPPNEDIFDQLAAHKEGIDSLALIHPSAWKGSSRLVVFASYEVEERAPYLGETRAWIGAATWKRLDRTTVETLVGGKV